MTAKRIKAPTVAPVLALALCLPLAACASTSGNSALSASSVPARYRYHPADITVSAGGKIKFTNHDQTAHTASSSHTAFDTGTLNPGTSVTVTLKRVGPDTYHCQFHPFMRATVTVT
jgi:plastocyanin